MTTHHADCDGYRTEHRTSIETTSYSTGVMTYQAKCAQCFATSPIFGKAAERLAYEWRNSHSSEVECDGRCKAWAER